MGIPINTVTTISNLPNAPAPRDDGTTYFAPTNYQETPAPNVSVGNQPMGQPPPPPKETNNGRPKVNPKDASAQGGRSSFAMQSDKPWLRYM